MKAQSRSSGTSVSLHQADKKGLISLKHLTGCCVSGLSFLPYCLLCQNVEYSSVLNHFPISLKDLSTKPSGWSLCSAKNARRQFSHHLLLEFFWRFLNQTKAERDGRCRGRVVLCLWLFWLESSLEVWRADCVLWLSSVAHGDWHRGGRMTWLDWHRLWPEELCLASPDMWVCL